MNQIDEGDRSQSLPMVELNALRMEAMAVYERCLTECATAPFERFLERQLIQSPPPVALLNEISDDLFQRLQSLRQAQFDMRDRLLSAAQQGFHVELGATLPLRDIDQLAELQAHKVAGSRAFKLTAKNREALAVLLEDTREAATRLSSQRTITEQLYSNVMDWATALHVLVIRDQWRTPHEPIVQNVWSAAL